MSDYIQAAKTAQKESRRQESLLNAFDQRSERTADARYIVRHLWIIGVGLPVVLSIAALLLWGAR
jgi:hypothetical protein